MYKLGDVNIFLPPWKMVLSGIIYDVFVKVYKVWLRGFESCVTNGDKTICWNNIIIKRDVVDDGKLVVCE